jgi:hypothetical protein
VKIEPTDDVRSRDTSGGKPENGLIVDMNWDSGFVRVMPDAKEGLEVSEMILKFDDVQPIHSFSLDTAAITDELCFKIYCVLVDNIKRWSLRTKKFKHC